MPDFLKTNEILDLLELKEEMSAAEFGCGSAVFALSLAKRLNKGKIYALDIQEEKLSALKGKVAKENINNISTVLCDLEAPNGSGLPANSLDIVLIPNMLFQAENKSAIIKEGHRALKPGGQMLVIDWFKQVPFGPKTMVSPDEMKKIAQGFGLTLKREFAAGDYHYGLIFTK